MPTDSPTVNRDAIRLLPKAKGNGSPREPPSVAEDKRAKKIPTDLIVPYFRLEESSVVLKHTEIRGKQSTPIVILSMDEGEDAPNTTTHESTDMDKQEGNVQTKEEGELTSSPEAIKTETVVMGHTPENLLQGRPSPVVQTPKPVLHHDTRPLRGRRLPNFLEERFFTSAVTTE